MDFLNELFGSEMGELKRHQKVTIHTLHTLLFFLGAGIINTFLYVEWKTH